MKVGAIRQALLLVCLAFVPAIGHAIYFRDKVSWQSPVAPSQMVSLATARSWGETAIWVDARPDEQFAAEHVPNAVPLNEDHWNEQLPRFLAIWSPAKKTVVYCSSQSCNLALEVAQRLRDEAHLENVFVLEGGWEQWLKSKR